MRNEVIGITSVFVVVLVLFVLRQFILTIGQEKRKRSVGPAMPSATDKSKNSDSDDAWLFWTPEPHGTDSSGGLFDELAKRRAQGERKGSA